MTINSTVEDILKDIPRFRILCVGRAGVGKSSLINRVFGITGAKASDYVPGEASIGIEFTSDENKYFVLHDSKGFEPGDHATFDLAKRFLRERHAEKYLKDRLHAIWLCVETPRAGGRVFEEGDKKLLKLAHELQTPVVIVFTKYDKLVLSKGLEELEEDEHLDEETVRERSKANASKAFAHSVYSLDRSTATIRIPTPPYINISVCRGYEKSISDLVDMTRKLVHERLKGDAWVTWAIAQRANLPVKIETCIENGINYYYCALAGAMPGVGNVLLWECLAQVHQDIITCWNFKDEQKILGGTEFKQLMMYLVEELHTRSPATTEPSLDKIGQFVNLISATTIPFAPPVAILGLTYVFVRWVSNAVLERVPEVERLLMAYTIDLISVLISLFDFTLKPDLAGTTNWGVLKEAFEAYEHSDKRKEIHAWCQSTYNGKEPTLTREHFRQTITQLVGVLASEIGA